MPVPAILASMLNSIVGSAVNAAMENTVYAPPLPPELGVVGARAFPEGTKKGEMEPLQGMMEVVIGGKAFARAPGLQIRNQQNLIVMPATIQGTVPVRYQLDSSGAVLRVWLLTRTEIAAP
ncbi:MAG: hypothetical protein IPL58_08755 [Betaproteobacteria bacterium]|jgi:hypothetical protein|uniref:IPT/TIG domain-containing protein n=1 Tax=Candidatus Proximibacter danicus TaxID=2954365 RepID=A0A9D7K2H4_9PROT|nr:hypothetical protein [Candidatus Proximibacter danicus]MBK9447323.1 hypothetical protein [Betaproteobacteria bacterium]